VLGNHDYYSGAAPWTAHFEAMGFRVLRNAHVTTARGAARLLIGGVIDFAARMSDADARPRPDLATDGEARPAFRLLLAHNPKIAPLAEQAGFDLQLSGHTHAGQFFPWTFVIHLVHGPHATGLSRRGRLWVYVSAGTGTWGPPVRLGTRPELTHPPAPRGRERAVPPLDVRRSTAPSSSCDNEVTDPAGFEEYRQKVPSTVERYGGKFLVRGGQTQTLESDWKPKRIVVTEFPTIEQARRWYDSEEYGALKALRSRTTRGSVVLVEGV
jgi:uncharacterized protein (DUF1330 family)